MATRSQAVVPSGVALAPAIGEERRTVLVVDDSPSFLELACLVLEAMDAVEVIGTAENGAEAIRAVLEHHPEVVLMDVDMPHINGLVACSILSLAFVETRVVLMSAEDTPALRAECAQAGAHAFIRKADLTTDVPGAVQDIEPRRQTAGV